LFASRNVCSSLQHTSQNVIDRGEFLRDPGGAGDWKGGAAAKHKG